MQVEIRQSPFDPWAEVGAHEEALEAAGRFGAAAVFVGTMRDFNEGVDVSSMDLEHYPGMTERHIREICGEAQARWDLLDTLVLHRVGRIAIGEAIVVVAAWSAHRGDAMDACRFIIEDLKSRAPFWKKEQTAAGGRWVDRNTEGYARRSEKVAK